MYPCIYFKVLFLFREISKYGEKIRKKYKLEAEFPYHSLYIKTQKIPYCLFLERVGFSNLK